MKIIDPPIIVSVCLETQRRIARARSRNNTGPLPPRPAERSGTDPADPAGSRGGGDS